MGIRRIGLVDDMWHNTRIFDALSTMRLSQCALNVLVV